MINIFDVKIVKTDIVLSVRAQKLISIQVIMLKRLLVICHLPLLAMKWGSEFPDSFFMCQKVSNRETQWSFFSNTQKKNSHKIS